MHDDVSRMCVSRLKLYIYHSIQPSWKMLYGAITLNSRVSGVYGCIYAVHTFVDRKIRTKNVYGVKSNIVVNLCPIPYSRSNDPTFVNESHKLKVWRNCQIGPGNVIT